MQMKVNTYQSSQKHIYHNHCQLSNTTPGCTLLICVCIFMLPELELAAEHVQITTMYHMNFINVLWHVTFICAPLTLPSLNNVLPAIILQNKVVWSNIRFQSCGSFHSNVSPSLCLNVLSGIGRRVVEVWVVLLLLLSGDIEVNPGPVGGKLTSNDLGCVLEEVLDVSAQCYNLGLQLKVRTGTLDCIRKQFSDPKDQLREVLKTWLTTCDNTNWKTLINALRSRSVGACQLAGDLEIKYCQMERAEVHVDSGPDVPVHPPLLLSGTPLDRYAKYLKLCYNIPFTSTKWPHLNARKYVNLTVVNNAVYAGRKEQLMFRQQQVLGSIEDNLDPIAVGDILKPNTVYDDKQTKCFFTQVLIIGVSGIGKSTFAWEVCQKWGQHQLFCEYSLVVLANFQDKRVKEAKSISDLFYHPLPELQSEIIREISLTGGDGLLLILEGFHEVSASKRTMDSIFVRLFRGQELPKATVVLTTRPSASAELCHLCNSVNSCRIEVVGFGKKDIDKYIHNAFSDEQSLSDFKEYLALYPCICSMMYVPLNAAIVTHSYSSCKSNCHTVVRKTMTQLYSFLIRTLLLCNLKDKEEYKNAYISSFKDLPQPVYDQFCEICKIAYTGIMSAEAELIFQDLPSDFETLGLMQTYPELYIDRGTSLSYNFLHLTLQEFLAAYYISQQSRDEQVAFMREHTQSENLHVVSRFLAGLSELGSDLWDVVRGFASKPRGSLLEEETIKLEILHWLFESQDLSAITSVLGSDCVCFCYSCVNTLPLDWYVLGYCITHSSCDWKLELQHCQLESAEMFLRAVNQQQGQRLLPWKVKGLWFRWSTPAAVKVFVANPVFYNLTHLCLMSSRLTSQTCNELSKHTDLLKHIEYLNLTDNLIDRGGTVNLIAALTKFNTIRELNLYCTGIGFEDCKGLSELLASSKKIEVLNIGGNALSPDSVQFIIDGVSHNTSLEKLLLCSSNFSSENVLSLASVLKVNTRLKNLDIRYCSILSGDFARLVKALNENTTTQLQALKLSGNPICSEGTVAFATMLARNKSLSEIYTSCCSIQGEGAVCLAHTMKLNFTVSYLDISHNPIGSEGVAAFAEMLAVNKHLAKLDMRQCNIQGKEAVCLAKAMEKNCAVTALYISGNPIASEGAAAFAGVLKRNQCLKILWLNGAIGSVESSLQLIKSLRHNGTLEKLWLSDEHKPPSFSTLDKALQDRVNFI